MKTPRDLNGAELIKKLRKYGYKVAHQTGSHIIVQTQTNGIHTLSIPNHKPLKVGTLDSILGEIAEHFGIAKKELMTQISQH
jgi:predicted RNA binding protein YcfA (HicA-like mRNA interferase family)